MTTIDFTDSLHRALYMPVNCAVSHDETQNALKLSTNSGENVMVTFNYLVTGFHLQAEDYILYAT